MPEQGNESWTDLVSVEDSGSHPDLISPAELIRYLDSVSDRRPPDRGDDEGDETELGDTSRLPRIKSMPTGIKVEERRVGRAVAQWVLLVRCECGRRWFELDTVDSTNCPRCGMQVYVDIDARHSRGR